MWTFPPVGRKKAIYVKHFRAKILHQNREEKAEKSLYCTHSLFFDAQIQRRTVCHLAQLKEYRLPNNKINFVAVAEALPLQDGKPKPDEDFARSLNRALQTRSYRERKKVSSDSKTSTTISKSSTSSKSSNNKSSHEPKRKSSSTNKSVTMSSKKPAQRLAALTEDYSSDDSISSVKLLDKTLKYADDMHGRNVAFRTKIFEQNERMLDATDRDSEAFNELREDVSQYMMNRKKKPDRFDDIDDVPEGKGMSCVSLLRLSPPFTV
jgi:hypothetical protein